VSWRLLLGLFARCHDIQYNYTQHSGLICDTSMTLMMNLIRYNQLPLLFCYFHLVKNRKIANYPTTTEAKEKRDRFEILGILF